MGNLPEITNSQIKLYASLNHKKYREQYGLFLADGPHLVQSAVSSGWAIEKIVITREKLDLIEKLNLPAEQLALCQTAKFGKIAPSQTPQGILAIVKIPDIAQNIDQIIKSARRAVACDNVSDPGNLGTIIRTAAAFGYDMVVCVGNCAEIYNPKTIRATQGGLFAIPVFKIDTAAEFLKLFADQFNLIALSGKAKKPMSKSPRIKRPILVVGGETAGISPEIETRANFHFRIEQTDKIESLNVAVAAGVAMYKFSHGFGK
jgi:TrmH family RNA methyltransferase